MWSTSFVYVILGQKTSPRLGVIETGAPMFKGVIIYGVVWFAL